MDKYSSPLDTGSFNYILSIVLPKNGKNIRKTIGASSFIDLVSGFSKIFSTNYNKMLATAYGDSGDGDEYITSKKHLTDMIRGRGWYFGCSGILLDLQDKSSLYMSLTNDILVSFSTQENPVFPKNFIHDIELSSRGIEISITSTVKLPENINTENFINTSSGSKLSLLFKTSVGRNPCISLLSNKQYSSIGWDEVDDMKPIDTLKKLLEFHDIELSSFKINQILLEKNILEECIIKSSVNSQKIQKYKKLTEKGLQYGKDYKQSKVTVPYYYRDKFEELVELYINN